MLFIFLCCCGESFAADGTFDPNNYRRFVIDAKTITLYNKYGDKNNALLSFTLSDNTEWHVADTERHSIVPQGPIEIDAEIFISACLSKKRQEDYRFEYKKFNGYEYFRGWLISDSKKNLPTLIKVHHNCIPNGWFTSPEYEHILELSDGSKWKITDKVSKAKLENDWKKGNHLIVSSEKESDYQKWVIINTDKEKEITISESEADETVRCTLQVYYNVEPYLH